MPTCTEIVEALECDRPGCPCQRRFGNNLLTHCPAHDDRTPSLSVKEGADGKVLINCHSNCDQQAVIDALKARDLWPLPNNKPEPSVKSRVVATYNYTDKQGEMLYQVLRKEPKGFSQRRPDGKGGWVYSLEGVRRVLYRLPELIAAVQAGQTVFIAEGEKDADALWKLGVPATCNSGGAGKWSEEFSDAFCGAGVILLPDNDKAGRDHATLVAASLLHGKAKRVRVVELPGLPDKGDVSDWLAAGGTKDALVQIV